MSDQIQTLKIADKYYGKEKYDKALAEYLKVLEISPFNEMAINKAVSCFINLEKKDDAKKLLEKYAEYLSNHGKSLKAIAVYKQILAFDKDNILIKKQVADELMTLNHEIEAIPYLQELKKYYIIRKFYSRAIDILIYIYQQRPNDVYVIEELLRLCASHNENYYLLSKIQEFLNDEKGVGPNREWAEGIVDRLIKDYPQNVSLLILKSRIFYQEKQVKDALRLISKAFYLEQDNIEIICDIAKIMISLEKKKEAELVLDLLNSKIEEYKLSNDSEIVVLYNTLLDLKDSLIDQDNLRVTGKINITQTLNPVQDIEKTQLSHDIPLEKEVKTEEKPQIKNEDKKDDNDVKGRPRAPSFPKKKIKEEKQEDVYKDLVTLLGVDILDDYKIDSNTEHLKNKFVNELNKKLSAKMSEKDHIDLGIAFWTMGIFDEAEKEFLVTNSSKGFYLAAKLNFTNEKYFKSLEYISKIEHEDIEVLYLAGENYEKLGKSQIANKYFEKVYRLNPDYREVRRKVTLA